MKITRWFNYILRPLLKHRAMRFPTFSHALHTRMLEYGDYHRIATMGLAVQRILTENIPGSFAEVGVYKGDMTRFIHQAAPDRKYYLLDTFAGFDKKDLDSKDIGDSRFSNTCIENVINTTGSADNLVFIKGYVPDTLSKIHDQLFSFVLLDLDKYKPTCASLEFFYPRLSKGGYLFIHDYNSAESDWACHRAVNEFFIDKPEKPVEIADICGSVVFRKL